MLARSSSAKRAADILGDMIWVEAGCDQEESWSDVQEREHGTRSGAEWTVPVTTSMSVHLIPRSHIGGLGK